MTGCPACQSPVADDATACGTCGQALALPPAIRPGFVLASRYEIHSLLGKGGMGMVYRAHDRILDETVAIKVLRPDIADTPVAAQRFISEIKLARAVSHRNVCRIHEYGEDRGIRFVSMAHVDGVDLKHVVSQRGPLPAEEAFEIAIRVADGLQAIHDEGIIHRDLKATNVMVGGRAGVRLMDFGIAKQWNTQTAPGMTATGHIVGTPECMSPEQVRGERLDFRSDVYSLGILVFELFTGSTPFQGDTPVAVILKQLQDPPPLHGPEAARLPAAVLPVLAKALAKRREERYETAREMQEALDHARAAHRAGAPTLIPSLDATRDRPDAASATRTTARPTPAAVQAALEPGERDRAPRRPEPRPAPRPRAIPLALVGGAAVALAVAGAWAILRPPQRDLRNAPATPLPASTSQSADGVVVERAPSAPPPSSPPSVHAPTAEPTRRAEGPRPSAAPTAAPATAPPRPTAAPSQASTGAGTGSERSGPTPAEARVNALLAQAEKALEGQMYDAAIAVYDEVLQLDPRNAIARMGRATAVNARVTTRALGTRAAPPAPGRKFVAGRTRADSAERREADKPLSDAFDTTGMEVTRDTQAATLPGRIEFKAEPDSVRAGERYSVSVYLSNPGRAPIEVRDVLVTTTVNDRKASGPVPHQTRVVAPGQRGLLLAVSDHWMDGVAEWSLEVSVRTTAGEVYRAELAWK